MFNRLNLIRHFQCLCTGGFSTYPSLLCCQSKALAWLQLEGSRICVVWRGSVEPPSGLSRMKSFFVVASSRIRHPETGERVQQRKVYLHVYREPDGGSWMPCTSPDTGHRMLPEPWTSQLISQHTLVPRSGTNDRISSRRNVGSKSGTVSYRMWHDAW